jgi:hypothetical protein
MKVIIDRFEGDFAVCEKEDRTMIDIKRILIPKEAKEGAVLNIVDEEITLDLEETEKRRNLVIELTKDLWEE